MKRLVLTLMLMVITLSADSSKKSSVRRTSESREYGKSATATGRDKGPGGAGWTGEAGEEGADVDLAVVVPFKRDVDTPSATLTPQFIRFKIKAYTHGPREVALAMAVAWNRDTRHACAAKADGNNVVQFYGKDCGREPLKQATVYVNGESLGGIPYCDDLHLKVTENLWLCVERPSGGSTLRGSKRKHGT